MTTYSIDLAINDTMAPLGTSMDPSSLSTYLPMQFAARDGNQSHFLMGEGGFEGGDTVVFTVYDLSPSPQGCDTNLQFGIFPVDLDGNFDQIFSSYPAPASRQGNGLFYGYSGYSSSHTSPAYGNAPCYSFPSEFTFASVSQKDQAIATKLSFSFNAWGRIYLVDPEMIVRAQGG